MWWLALLACTSEPAPAPSDTGPVTAPWSRELPSAASLPDDRGWSHRRAITHLHSPWSHDACDGDPQPDGVPDPACLADLREGLCATRVDAAFLTDHPATAAAQTYDDLFLAQDGDQPWPADGDRRANQLSCADGHRVAWFPGIEDETMPLGLDRHVSADPAVNDAVYNGYDADTVRAEADAGALVFVAHTEQRLAADLERLQDAGLVGVEVFNLHAMFDPDIREDALGLDGLGWLTEIAPFTDPAQTGEPDLFVLAVLQEQAPSVAHLDALLARGPTVAIAGTDAHQNVLPLDLRDGERGDSYRRMLRWFSNQVLVDADDPGAIEAGLAAGRSYVAFEILGTPSGFSFSYDGPDGVVEMGGTAGVGGTLVVGCPVLAAGSPRGASSPDIAVTVFRDGAPWQTGCGRFPVTEAGNYRARVDIVPHHLAPFLGDTPEPWIHSYPWIYGNAVRVR